MKSLKYLAAILGAAWLVVGPIHAWSMGNDTGDGFNIQVNTFHNDETGSIEIYADWNDIEDASSYKVWVDQADFLTNGSSFSINVGIGGDFTFSVVAYDESGVEIKKSNEFTVKLPSANSQYVGKGKFSMRSGYNENANSQTWTGQETGSVNFVVYKETVIQSDGSVSTDYVAYGTGKAGFGEEVYGGNMHHFISGNGTLSVQGYFYGKVVQPNHIPCIMALTFSTSYPSVEQVSSWAGYSDTLYWSWNEKYETAGMQLQNEATYDVVDFKYGAITRTVRFTLEEISLSEPDLSACLQ